MKDSNPWPKEIRRRGNGPSPTFTLTTGRPLKQALEELAERESEKYRQPISVATVFTTLATTNTREIAQIRKDLTKRAKQIKREISK